MGDQVKRSLKWTPVEEVAVVLIYPKFGVQSLEGKLFLCRSKFLSSSLHDDQVPPPSLGRRLEKPLKRERPGQELQRSDSKFHFWRRKEKPFELLLFAGPGGVSSGQLAFRHHEDVSIWNNLHFLKVLAHMLKMHTPTSLFCRSGYL